MFSELGPTTGLWCGRKLCGTNTTLNNCTQPWVVYNDKGSVVINTLAEGHFSEKGCV